MMYFHDRTPVTRLVIVTAALAAVPGSVCAQNINAKFDLWNQKRTLLRGANVWQKAVFKEGETFVYVGMETSYGAANLKKMKDWNANYVNISHPGLRHTHPRNGSYPVVPAIRANVTNLIELAGINNLFVVISFRTGPGRTEEVFSREDRKGRLDYLFQLDPETEKLTAEARAAQDAWVEMWEETATAFKDVPNVVGFDLLVEPFTDWEQKSGTKPPRRQSGDLSAAQKRAWRDFALRMAHAIRKVDQRTPILVGPAPYNAAWALDEFPVKPFLDLKLGPVVIAVHQYGPEEYTHQDRPTTYADKQREQLKSRYKEIADYETGNRCPLAVNEFGMIRWAGPVANPDSPTFLKEQLSLLESQGRNHALWLWEVDKIKYYDFHFRLGVDKRRTEEPAPGSDPLVNAIKDNWRANRIFATDDVVGRWK
jgi:hypothetical protein